MTALLGQGPWRLFTGSPNPQSNAALQRGRMAYPGQRQCGGGGGQWMTVALLTPVLWPTPRQNRLYSSRAAGPTWCPAPAPPAQASRSTAPANLTPNLAVWRSTLDAILRRAPAPSLAVAAFRVPACGGQRRSNLVKRQMQVTSPPTTGPI